MVAASSRDLRLKNAANRPAIPWLLPQSDRAIVKLTDLRGILRYVPQFRDKTFILGVDAGIVTDENFPNILLDIALLRSLNVRVVVVHGAAEQIEPCPKSTTSRPPTS